MSDNMKSSRGIHYGYVVLVCACVFCACIAGNTISAAGIFFEKVAGELGVGLGNISLYITIMFLTMTVFLPFAGKIMEKYDVRLITIAVALLAAGSYFAMSKFTSVYQYYITGFTLGIANTFALYLIGPMLVNRWFKARTGFYLGIVMAFSGVGAVVFNPIAGYFISNYGWRSAYMYLALIILVAGVCCGLLLRSRPQDKGLRAIGDTGGSAAAKKVLEAGVPASVALKSAPFFLACLFSFCISVIGGGVNQYMAPLAANYGFELSAAAMVVSAYAMGNMFGKPVLGAIADKFLKASIWTACGAGVLGMVILLNVPKLGFWSMYVGGIIFGVAVGSCMPISAIVVRRIFGGRDYPAIYSYNQMMTAIASGVGAMLIGFVKDLTGGFQQILTIAAIVYIIIGIIGMIALSTGKKLVWLEREEIN